MMFQVGKHFDLIVRSGGGLLSVSREKIEVEHSGRTVRGHRDRSPSGYHMTPAAARPRTAVGTTPDTRRLQESPTISVGAEDRTPPLILDQSSFSTTCTWYCCCIFLPYI